MTPIQTKIEETIKRIGDNIVSVDSHYINVIGEGGTVAEQIVRKEIYTLMEEVVKICDDIIISILKSKE